MVRLPRTAGARLTSAIAQVTYLYVFAAPLLFHASQISGSSAPHAAQLRRVANKNASLAATSLIFQVATAVLFLVVTEVYDINIIYVSQVATMMSLADVVVSLLCTCAMTNVWMSRSLRAHFRGASDVAPSALGSTEIAPLGVSPMGDDKRVRSVQVNQSSVASRS